MKQRNMKYIIQTSVVDEEENQSQTQQIGQNEQRQVTRESGDNEERLEVESVEESDADDNLPLHYYGKGR